MAHNVGKALYVEFQGVDISADFRTFSASGKLATADTTAGADDDETFLPTTKDFNFDYGGIWENSSAGTTILGVLRLGQNGTLIYGPDGSASGSLKWECEAYVIVEDYTFDSKKESEIKRQFKRNGGWIVEGSQGGTFA